MQRVLWIILGCCMALAAHAAPSIAILDFELRDLTLAPGIPAELQRTASIQKLLAQELQRAGYPQVSVERRVQQQANAGFGYLFEHHDEAAALARSVHADYILVGRLHKPSFLFMYLQGHLVRAVDGRWVGNYSVESKGGEQKLTLKAVESLAEKIAESLAQQSTLPAPTGR